MILKNNINIFPVIIKTHTRKTQKYYLYINYGDITKNEDGNSLNYI